MSSDGRLTTSSRASASPRSPISRTSPRRSPRSPAAARAGTAPARTVYDPRSSRPKTSARDPEPPPPDRAGARAEREPLGEDGRLTAGAMAAVGIDPTPSSSTLSPGGLWAGRGAHRGGRRPKGDHRGRAPEEIARGRPRMTSADQPAVVEPPPPDRSTATGRRSSARSRRPARSRRRREGAHQRAEVVAPRRTTAGSWRTRTDRTRGRRPSSLQDRERLREAPEDLNEAFNTLVDARDRARERGEVVNQLDRVAEAAQAPRRASRTGAEAPRAGRLRREARRVYPRTSSTGTRSSQGERGPSPHLGHRAPRQGASPSWRAAQIAAMNGDVKVQREHLARAMERTVRRGEGGASSPAGERVGDHAGGDQSTTRPPSRSSRRPSSPLQGVKRLGKKELTCR